MKSSLNKTAANLATSPSGYSHPTFPSLCPSAFEVTTYNTSHTPNYSSRSYRGGGRGQAAGDEARQNVITATGRSGGEGKGLHPAGLEGMNQLLVWGLLSHHGSCILKGGLVGLLKPGRDLPAGMNGGICSMPPPLANWQASGTNSTFSSGRRR